LNNPVSVLPDLKEFLDSKVEQFNRPGFIENDPISIRREARGGARPFRDRQVSVAPLSRPMTVEDTIWQSVRVEGDLQRARIEWLHTNGAGAYASSTVAQLHTRRYHGLLVAALDCFSALHSNATQAPPASRPTASAEALRLNTLGVAFLNQQKGAEAQKYFEKALALDPKFAVARVNLGIALLSQQKLEQGRAALEQAAAELPNDPYASYNLGLRWFPVPAGGDLGRGPLVPAIWPVLSGCRGAAGRARCHC
jgi:hypothetical protein